MSGRLKDGSPFCPEIHREQAQMFFPYIRRRGVFRDGRAVFVRRPFVKSDLEAVGRLGPSGPEAIAYVAAYQELAAQIFFFRLMSSSRAASNWLTAQSLAVEPRPSAPGRRSPFFLILPQGASTPDAG